MKNQMWCPTCGRVDSCDDDEYCESCGAPIISKSVQQEIFASWAEECFGLSPLDKPGMSMEDYLQAVLDRSKATPKEERQEERPTSTVDQLQAILNMDLSKGPYERGATTFEMSLPLTPEQIRSIPLPGRGREGTPQESKDTWWAYECVGECMGNGSGVVFDVRTDNENKSFPPDGFPPSSVTCPVCQGRARYSGSWQADASGHGSRSDPTYGRDVTDELLRVLTMIEWHHHENEETSEEWDSCPICFGDKPNHRTGCAVAKVKETLTRSSIQDSPQDHVVLKRAQWELLRSTLNAWNTQIITEWGPNDCPHGDAENACDVGCECGHPCRDHIPIQDDSGELTGKLCSHSGCQCGC